MLYLIEDLENWKDKYKLTEKVGKCLKCQKDIKTDTPFADGKLRGLTSIDHGCGKEYTLITFKVTDEDFNSMISRFDPTPVNV